jgi:hypothetical protein
VPQAASQRIRSTLRVAVATQDADFSTFAMVEVVAV